MPASASHRRAGPGRLSSLWKRFLSRLPAGTGAGIGYSCLVLLGLLLLYDRRANETLPGILALTAGIAGLTWQGRRWRDTWIARRMEKHKAEQRVRQHKLRRARQEIERQETARKKQQTSYAKQRASEAAEARRRTLRQQEEIRAAQEEAHLHALDEETRHLLSLSEEEFRQALVFIFQKQGVHPHPIQDEAMCDILLTDVDSRSVSVVRLVPRDRKAEAADVRALDAWRTQETAVNAYLIALSGFSPPAVREASRLPVTLVEAHLLAHWSIQDERLPHDP